MRWLLLSIVTVIAGCSDSSDVSIPAPRPSYEPALPAGPRAILTARQDAVDENRSDAKAWGDLGSTYLADKHYGDAAMCFQQVVRLDPGNGPPWMLLALAYEEGGHPDAAMDAYQRGITADRVMPALLWRASLLHLDEGRVVEALGLATKAVQIDPTDRMARVVLSRALLANDRPRDAAGVLSKLLQERPDDRYAHLLQGRAMQRAHISGAAAHQRLGGSATPVWSDPWTTASLTLGVTAAARRRVAASLVEQGQFAIAVQALRQLAQEQPDQIGTRVLLAKALRSAGQGDEALAMMEVVLADNPDEHPVLTQAAAALFTRWQKRAAAADLEQALVYLDRAVGLTQTDGQNWSLRANVRRLSGDLDGAASDLAAAAALMPHKPGLAMQAADIRLQLGEPAEALLLLAPLRGDFQNNVNMLLLSARARHMSGDREGALLDVAKAAAAAPRDRRVEELMNELSPQ